MTSVTRFGLKPVMIFGMPKCPLRSASESRSMAPDRFTTVNSCGSATTIATPVTLSLSLWTYTSALAPSDVLLKPTIRDQAGPFN